MAYSTDLDDLDVLGDLDNVDDLDVYFGNLDRAMKILGEVAADATASDTAKQLAQEASSGMEKLKQILIRSSLILDMALLVKASDWGTFTKQLQNNCSSVTDQENVVKEVVAFIYEKDSFMNARRETICCWLDHLAPELQVAACEALYRQLKPPDDSKKHLLLLLEHITKWPILVQDNVRAQLRNNCGNITRPIVKCIKKKEKDLTACSELHKLKVLKFFMPQILSAFDMTKLKNVLLLIYFSEKICIVIGDEEVCHCIVSTLLKTLEESSMLGSEQALHVWAHVKSYNMHLQRIRPPSFTTESWLLFKATEIELEVKKACLLLHFQKYVESFKDDTLKMIDVMDHNKHLVAIVPEFISWYLRDDAERKQRLSNLCALAKSGIRYSTGVFILEHVHEEMIRLQKMDTFEAFRLFSEFKKQSMPLRNVPECVRLLLTCSEKYELQVINKFFPAFLGALEEKPCCFVNKDLDLCRAEVDYITDKVSFSFKSGNVCWETNLMEADGTVTADEGVKVHLWMIKPVDEQHIKIFTVDGIYIYMAILLVTFSYLHFTVYKKFRIFAN